MIAAVLGFVPVASAGAEPTKTPEQAMPSVAEAESDLDQAKLRAVKDLNDPSLLRLVALAYLRLGDALKATGKLDEALTQLQAGLSIAKEVAEKDPGDSRAQSILFRFYERIGNLQKTQGATAAAMRSYQRRLALAGMLAEQDPSRFDGQLNLAESHNAVGDVLAVQGDHAKALQHYQHGLVITNKVSEANPGNASIKAELDASVERVRGTIRKLGETKPGASTPGGGGDIVPGGGDGYLPSRPIPSKPAPASVPSRPAPKPGQAAAPSALPTFPWPPPRASATYVLPRSLLADYRTVGDFTGALLSALETNGYVERSFYRTPQDGVTLVTRLERINDDGSPVADATRWPASARHNEETLSLYELLRGLFYADPGRYRVIVFVLQTPPFTQSPETVTPEQARAWLSSGANVLPPNIAARPIADAHCTALIYEFASDGSNVRVVTSGLTGKGHLDKAGLIATLDNAP